MQYEMRKQMRGELYCEEKPMCEITIYIIHCAKCVLKCAHILIAPYILSRKCQCVQKILLHLINNIQPTGADNICTGRTCRCGYLHYCPLSSSKRPDVSSVTAPQNKPQGKKIM